MRPLCSNAYKSYKLEIAMRSTRSMVTAPAFAFIVKWSGLFYDIRDNGPDEGTSASLY
jgi:hypothetical protein